MPDFRLYVDETGDHTKCVDPKAPVGRRYLGLVGVMMPRDESYQAFAKTIEEFKRKHLPYDADEPPPILHRQDILNRSGPFYRLQDRQRAEAFDAELLALIKRQPFTLIATVVDKLTHGRATYRMLGHPYHYCLLAMLERYCGLLARKKSRGDLMVEARGRVEDAAFDEAYADLYQHGSGGRGYLAPELAKATLTSKHPKVRKKEANVTGLQIADLLAHTATRDVLARVKRAEPLASPFAQELTATIQGKYNRHLWTGQVQGWGRVLLV